MDDLRNALRWGVDIKIFGDGGTNVNVVVSCSGVEIDEQFDLYRKDLEPMILWRIRENIVDAYKQKLERDGLQTKIR